MIHGAGSPPATNLDGASDMTDIATKSVDGRDAVEPTEIVKQGMSISRQAGLIGTILVMVLTFIGYSLRWFAVELAKPWVDDHRNMMKTQQTQLVKQGEIMGQISSAMAEIHKDVVANGHMMKHITDKMDDMESKK